MEGRLTLHSHGVETQYEILSALYHVADGRLSLAVEARVADRGNEDAPRDLSLALRNVAYDGPGSTLAIRDDHHTWGVRDSSPHAYVYSGFHHTTVDARGTVTSLGDDRLTLELEITTDDVVFYDERATESKLRGRLVLLPADPADLWAP